MQFGPNIIPSWHQTGNLRRGFDPQHLLATFDPGLPKATNINSLSVPLMTKFVRCTLKDKKNLLNYNSL